MLIAQHVPEDVWAALPPRRLPRWRVLGALVLLAAIVFGVYVAEQSGVLSPNLQAQSYGGSWKEGSGTFTTVTTLTNEGSRPLTIESAAVSGGTWLRLDRVTNADQRSVDETDVALPPVLPVTLEPHEGVSIELWFTVTDCSRIDRKGLTLTAQASSPLRTTTVDITPAGDQDPEAPGSYSWSGGVDPWLVPWPATYAASACSVPLPPKP
jgi:hypothetical protein